MITLTVWDLVLIAAIVWCPKLWGSISTRLQLEHRLDRARYALACDTEACEHYGEKQDVWFRTRIAVRAFALNK